jgi:hypothetical protein
MRGSIISSFSQVTYAGAGWGFNQFYAAAAPGALLAEQTRFCQYVKVIPSFPQGRPAWRDLARSFG